MANSLAFQRKVWILSKFGFRNKSQILDLFRRTRASGLYQDGVDISLISKVLGHSSIETTKDHYAIPSLEQKKAAMEKGSSCEPGVQQEQMWPDDEDELARICGLT